MAEKKRFISKHPEHQKAVQLVCGILEEELNKQAIIEAKLQSVENVELSLKAFLGELSQIINEMLQVLEISSYSGMPLTPFFAPTNARLSLRITSAIIPMINELTTAHMSPDRKVTIDFIFETILMSLMQNWIDQERLIGEKDNLRIRISGIKVNQVVPTVKIDPQ